MLGNGLVHDIVSLLYYYFAPLLSDWVIQIYYYSPLSPLSHI